MQRYKMVLGGTVAGIAGVLAFPTAKGHLSIPSASAGATASSPSTSHSSSGSSATSAPAATSSAATTRSATSADESFQYGDIAVTVTARGRTITKVSVASLNETDNHSVEIDHYAIPQLEQQVISAGSVNIDGVSGATFTSQAFVNAVQSALQKLGIS